MKHITQAHRLLRYSWVVAIAVALLAVAYIYKEVTEHPPVQLTIERNTRIDLTPEQIQSVRDIGQWEFLSINTEELVEWHRHRTFGNDHLTRIYQGTLRIGIDMSHASANWFTSLPDSTARLLLPKVALLDNNFIDEARTRSFYESGSIPPEARDLLYTQARNKMKQRCLTPQNMQTAERTARSEFTKLFTSLGFKHVIIEFEHQK